jgi:hypothetical protein
LAGAASPEFAPVLVLEALLAAFSAVLFGLIAGRPLRRLAYMLPAGLAGVLLGQFIGDQMRSPGLVLGDLHLLEATLGAWMVLLIARRLGV